MRVFLSSFLFSFFSILSIIVSIIRIMMTIIIMIYLKITALIRQGNIVLQFNNIVPCQSNQLQPLYTLHTNLLQPKVQENVFRIASMRFLFFNFFKCFFISFATFAVSDEVDPNSDFALIRKIFARYLGIERNRSQLINLNIHPSFAVI